MPASLPVPIEQLADVSFNLYQGYLIVVEGRIGDLQHQNFLLDTGASPSMIDRSIAEKLRLQGPSGGLLLFNKKLAAENVILPDLQFGSLRRRNLPVMVTDFSNIGRAMGTHIDAVIGLDVLGTTNFTIDFQKRRISFRASRERYSASFTETDQFIAVNFGTGSRQLHLLLDTGTPHLVLFQRTLHNLDYDWTPVTGSGQNVSGRIYYGTVVLRGARLGTIDMGPQKASVVATLPNAESDYDGLIGTSLLRPKQLSFDFDRQLLGWSN